MRYQYLLLAAALFVASCRSDSGPEADAAKDDDSVTTVMLPMQGERAPGFDSANAAVFHHIVYREYAGLAVSLPKKVADSILKTTPMEKIQDAMQARMDRQDSIARAQLAAKYKITTDSVEAILKMGREGKWK
jgi:hypothetical protein